MCRLRLGIFVNYLSKMNYFLTAISNPYRVPYFILKKIAPLFKDDEKYLKWYYFWNMHKFPDLKHPKSFNEKLTWLKLHDKHPEYSRLVDKYEVKQYIADKIGAQYVIPTLGVWDKAEDIDFDKLPDKFVLKVTSDSGGLIICNDKSKLNRKEAVRTMKRAQKRHFFAENREYPYRGVKPRIIAEQYMEAEPGKSLNDYKFFCFDGDVKMMFVATDRPVDTRIDFFDPDFNHLPFRRKYPWADKPLKKPEGFEEMKAVARKLAQGMRHVRVDLYDVGGGSISGNLPSFPHLPTHPLNPRNGTIK